MKEVVVLKPGFQPGKLTCQLIFHMRVNHSREHETALKKICTISEIM